MSIRLFALTALAGVVLVLFPPSIAHAQGGGVETMQWQGSEREIAEHLQLPPPVEYPLPPLRALLEELLASAELQLEIATELQPLLSDVQRIWRVATIHPGFEGQASVLARIALLRARIVWRLEGPEQALEETQRVLVPLVPVQRVGESLRLPQPFRPTSPVGLEIAQTALGDERLVALREELRRELSQEPGDDEILRAVRRAIFERGDLNFVRSIGERGRPALEQLCLEEPDQILSNPNCEPLRSLIELGETRAALFLQEHLDAGGDLWHQRILNSLRFRDILDDRDNWAGSSSEQTPPVCLVEEWLELLARLLDNPDLASPILEILPPVFRRDALAPELSQALGRIVLLGRPDFDRELLAILGSISFRLDSAQPLLESCLESSNQTLRRYAAEQLAQFERSEPLRALAADPDPRIRLTLARSLGPTPFTYATYGGGRVHNTYNSQTRPELGEHERAILARLAGDPEPSVREQAVRSIRALDEPLEAELYRQLLGDPSEKIRSLLVGIEYRDPEFEVEMLATLGRDSSGAVRYDVARRLRDRNWSDGDEPLVPIVLELRDLVDEVDLSSTLQNLYRTGYGFAPMVRWALERGEEDWLRNCAQHLHNSLAGRGRPVSAPLELLTDDEFQRLYLWAMGDARSRSSMEVLLSQIDPSQLVGLQGLVARTELSMDVRLVAARYSYLSQDEAHADDLIELLSDPSWSGRALSNPERQALLEFAEVLVESGRAEVLLRVVRTAEVSDTVGLAMARAYPQEGALGREITLAILERWFSEDSPTSFAVNSAIEHLGSLPGDATPELLERAVQHPGYARNAVLAVQQLRRPQYLHVLELALKGDGLPAKVRSLVQTMAAHTLVGFPSDEAVELLLEAYGWATSDTTRSTIDNALTKIRNYREQLAWWEGEQQSLPTVDDARIELFRMLDSDKPVFRAEAARSLAALGALEALPRLILLLEDADKDVREAARAALDRLQTPSGGSVGKSSGEAGGESGGG